MKKATNKKAALDNSNDIKEESSTMKKATNKKAALDNSNVNSNVNSNDIKEESSAMTESNEIQEFLSDSTDVTKDKAPRCYECTWLNGSDFTDNAFAKPLSPAAVEYWKSRYDFIQKMLTEIRAEKRALSGIIDDIRAAWRTSRDKAGAVDTLGNLITKYKLSVHTFRIVIQLCYPVVCVCNDTIDQIARRYFGKDKANAIMGSPCNSYLTNAVGYNAYKSYPFKRVCYNYTTLGGHFKPCNNITEIDDTTEYSDLKSLVIRFLLCAVGKLSTPFNDEYKPARSRSTEGSTKAKKPSIDADNFLDSIAEAEDKKRRPRRPASK